MTSYLKSVWFFIWMFLGFQLLGQTEIDSLFSQLKKAPSGQDSIVVMIDLLKSVQDENIALPYAKKVVLLSERLGNQKYTAQSYQQLGRWQIYSSHFDSSKINLKKAHQLFDQLNLDQAKAKNFFYFAVLFEEQYSYDSAEYYYQLAIDLSGSVNDESNTAKYHLFLGDMQNRRGNNKSAIQHLEAANKYYEVPSRMDSSWITLNSLGIVYDEMGLYAEGLEYYLKANTIVERLDDQDGKIILANNLGTIYHQLGNLEESKNHYSKGLETARINEFKLEEALLLNNISILHTEEGDTLKALGLLRRAYNLQIESDQDCDLAYTSEGLGEVMIWMKKYDSAKHYYNESLRLAKKCGIAGVELSVLRNKALLSKKIGNKRECETLLLESLSLGHKSGYYPEVKESALELYKYYKEINDLPSALKYHEMYSEVKDSLFDAKSTDRIARMTAEYDFRREIESLEYKKMADEMRLNEQIRQKESSQNTILVVLILTLLLAIALGRSYYLVQNHNKKLTALNEEKNTLMGVVAHDLRSPLNNIKGLISLMKMENSSLSPEQSHYFHLVDDTMERMRDMIDRVLDVSVVEDMKVSLNLTKVDLGKTMTTVANNFELLAEKKGIKIQSNIDLEKHFVYADYNYLLQIIENLLSNALKFSDTEKNIFMNIFQEDGSETMIVRDEGPGINEEDQKRLFNKFQKLSAKPTDNETSTGLGLSIVKKFVDAMDADISCESEVGVGTSFIITFKTEVEKELVQ